jgi:phytoene dehydrogenase-like protein
MHVDVGPDDRFGAGIGYMLAAAAAHGGFAVAGGGSAALTRALLARLARGGGELRLDSRVVQVIVEGGRARAVRTAAGEEHAARHGILAATSAHALLCELVGRHLVPGRVVRKLERDDPGTRGTFKVDWALARAVPWLQAEARSSAVVHTGEDVDDLARATSDARAGRLPERPYLVVGQQSLADPTRAPQGRHTLWAYTRAPARPPAGWDGSRERFADAIEQRIEALAPGFREAILARRIVTPLDLEAMDSNLRCGDIGGGPNDVTNQLLFRPAFPYFRYRMPVRGLYLASSYAHPGAGVHGMCGANAAERALADAGYR